MKTARQRILENLWTGSLGSFSRRSSVRGFTLVEVMATMSLILILVIAGMSGILAMGRASGRLADYTAAMAVVEAKVQDIRAASYNPPVAPFGSSTVYLTNSGAIALNQAGTSFKVAGTVVSKIEPVGSAHLITVTGTFQSPNQPIVVSLQTIVDKFSGGQQ